MLVGVDYDGVLAEFVNPFLAWHNKHYGTNLSRVEMNMFELSSFLGCDLPEAIRRVELYANSPSYKMPIIEGAQDGIDEIREAGHEAVVLTSRSAKLIQITLDWLKDNFPNKFRDAYFTNEWGLDGKKETKREVCRREGIKALVEDNADYACECAQDGVRVVLLDCPWNQKPKLPEGVVRAYSWREIPMHL